MTNTKSLRKILLIDNDKRYSKLLEPIFKKEDLKFIWAKDGSEGIEKTINELPDLVITEISLPKMNGFEIIKKIKSVSLTENINLVVLTNQGNNALCEDEMFTGTLGIKKYLLKSNYSPAEILTELRTLFV